MSKQVIYKRCIYCVDSIKWLLTNNDKFLISGLLRIYSHQTNDEKAVEGTKYINGIGFNSADAEILTSLAKFVLVKGYLTPKQKELARKKLPKYAKQLLMVTAEKAKREEGVTV